tara:strand:- start:3073 stop:4164 length:1092 start_codon:yes stop_codon:yes gene_type:complete
MAYSTIDKGSTHFDVLQYTGNSSNRTLTDLSFQPDFVWIKDKGNTRNHMLFDAVRAATKHIHTNDGDAEATLADTLTAFTSNGFSLGTDSTAGSALVNGNSNNYVSWNWKAGTGAGSSNTDGSINTVSTSVNNTAGFSISKYTGTGANATVGTGLNKEPKMLIVKNLTDGSTEWMIGFRGFQPSLTGNGFASNRYIHFTSASYSTNSSSWNSTAPTSAGVVSLGDGSYVNGSGKSYIMYAFADIDGYQKTGSYIANANTNGPFIYTGFKPAFFMMCNRDNNARWMIADNKRDVGNECNNRISPSSDAGNAVSGDIGCDFLSNGIKIRGGSTSNINYVAGNTYGYIAIADAPIVGSNNVPATAR